MGISVDDQCELVTTVTRKNHAPWPQVCDGNGLDGELPRLFNARGTPNYYLLSPDGRVAAKRIQASKLDGLLEEMLAR